MLTGEGTRSRLAETLAKVIELRKEVAKGDARRRTPARRCGRRWRRHSSCRPSTGRCTSTKPMRASRIRSPRIGRSSSASRSSGPTTSRCPSTRSRCWASPARWSARPSGRASPGTSTDLLLAVEKHPAMLLYLDNQASIGPNSKAARFVGRRGNGRKAGINENLAREILELHTLGVDGGYTQADVTTFAQAISGWSIGGQDNGRRLARLGVDNGTPGEFHFREIFHEPGAKKLVRQELWRRRPAPGRSHPARSCDASGNRAACFHQARAAFHRGRAAEGSRRSHHAAPGSIRRRICPRCTRRWSSRPRRGNSRWPSSRRRPTTSIPRIARSASRCATSVVRCRPFEALGQRNLMPGSPAGWPDTSADWDGSSASAQAHRLGRRRRAAHGRCAQRSRPRAAVVRGHAHR